ncbi:MAG: glycosyltransferase family 2 protein [Gammaproteobacteria bacterium]
MNISTIIPSHNRCFELHRALSSVMAQSHVSDEVIVVDDGSTDATAEMLRNEFPGVVYRYQPNQGVSAARNEGIRLARGQWLAFLDSDDEWLPDKLANQIDKLTEHPELKICHTEEIWIRNGCRVNAMQKHAKRGSRIFRACLPLCAMSPSSVLIHRSVFETVGLFDTDLPACEDYDLWLRITARYKVAFIEQAQIVKYGGHDDQLSRKYWGMDRFRIRSLARIIETGILENGDLRAAIDMLLKKAAVYHNGCLKRGKTEEAAYYAELMTRYRQRREAPVRTAS